MLSINQFHMKLPVAYQHQSQAIIDRVGSLLGESDLHGLNNIDVLNIPTVQINEGAGVNEIATGIADSIKSTLGVGE